jgi:tetratricopeptide (TPR) repeat protein
MRRPFGFTLLICLLPLFLMSCQTVQPNEETVQASVSASESETQVPELTREECIALLPTTESFLYAGDYDAADTIYTTVLACDIPDSLRTGVYRLLASLDSEKGDYDAAIEDYRQTLKLGLTDQDAAAVHNNICWFYVITDRAESALPHCEKAVALDPTPSHLDSRGVTYAMLGRTDAAIDDIQAAVEAWAGIQNSQAQEVRSARLVWLEQLKAGEDPFTPAVLDELKSESFQGVTPGTLTAAGDNVLAEEHFQRGREHHIWARLEEAVAEYTQALELVPEYEQARFYRGLVYTRLQQYEEAMADFEKVISTNSEYTNAYRLCAQTASEMGDLRKSVSCYDKAIELAPGVAEFYANRGLANFSLREMHRAIADFDEALRITRSRLPQILFSRGFAHYLLGHRVEAILDLELAIELGIPSEMEDLAEQMLLELKQVL